tara:strand:- start:406 stop:636 length:231 start_codon:yes stop_codon:yes gene_type:complete
MSVNNKILNIISKETKLSIDDIDINKNIHDLGLDSLATVEIVISIEEELGIVIPDDSVGDLQTVKDIIDLCNRLDT